MMKLCHNSAPLTDPCCRRRADSARNFSNVITTDSVPEIAKKLKAEGDCFTVLSLSEEIAEIVEHYVDH